MLHDSKAPAGLFYIRKIVGREEQKPDQRFGD